MWNLIEAIFACWKFPYIFGRWFPGRFSNEKRGKDWYFHHWERHRLLTFLDLHTFRAPYCHVQHNKNKMVENTYCKKLNEQLWSTEDKTWEEAAWNQRKTKDIVCLLKRSSYGACLSFCRQNCEDGVKQETKGIIFTHRNSFSLLFPLYFLLLCFFQHFLFLLRDKVHISVYSLLFLFSLFMWDYLLFWQ